MHNPARILHILNHLEEQSDENHPVSIKQIASH